MPTNHEKLNSHQILCFKIILYYTDAWVLCNCELRLIEWWVGGWTIRLPYIETMFDGLVSHLRGLLFFE
jgi:hypothetical protein